MSLEAWLYCGVPSGELADIKRRDELGVSAYCRQRMSQFCLYDCKYATMLIPRDGMKIQIVEDTSTINNLDQL
jgi:hypothetical protein